MLSLRAGMMEHPFIKVWTLAEEANTPCAKYVKELLQEVDTPQHEMAKVQERIRNSERTKSVTYKAEINPNLKVHNVYSCKTSTIPEHHRLAFTQLRLSAHNLAIETGRWSRIPREERLCVCGQIQTENHILAVCEKTEHIRRSTTCIHYFNIPQLFESEQ